MWQFLLFFQVVSDVRKLWQILSLQKPVWKSAFSILRRYWLLSLTCTPLRRPHHFILPPSAEIEHVICVVIKVIQCSGMSKALLLGQEWQCPRHPMQRAPEAGHEGYKPQLLQPVFRKQAEEFVEHENISLAEASPTVEKVMSHLPLGDFSLEYHFLLVTKCSNT